MIAGATGFRPSTSTIPCSTRARYFGIPFLTRHGACVIKGGLQGDKFLPIDERFNKVDGTLSAGLGVSGGSAVI